ncbi:MAG TPA: leucine-rich repeat domain-containing protein, partial [Verrucomicrobiae bacterium]
MDSNKRDARLRFIFRLASIERLLPMLLLLTLPAVVVNAQFTFTTNDDGSLNIVGYTGQSGAVVIPSTTNGYPITGIIETRSGGAFTFLTSLTNIMIPNSVTNIMQEPFKGCINLTTITVDALNSSYSSISGVFFDKSQTTLLEYPEGKAGSYIIPDSVTNIGTFAFDNCTGLTNVTILNSVISIGEFAFQSCTRLTNITIPSSVANIGYDAFFDCTSLISVFFNSNTPALADLIAFDADNNVTVYYL